ncbi:MAG: DNA-formamidopyrimidine glycosylase family protein [Anaerolineae bacterium]
MPELPEMAIFARDMRRVLTGRTVRGIEVRQDKLLNLPVHAFVAALDGAFIANVTPRGKWLQVDTSEGCLLINLGIGGDILLVDRQRMPERYQVAFDLDDGHTLALGFRGIGYCHYATDPLDHPMAGKVAADMLSVTRLGFHELLHGRRGTLKPFLMNQSIISGVGNVTIQPALWRAKVHPLRSIPTLTDDEIDAVWRELQATLREAIGQGGSHDQRNLYGACGGWRDPFLAAFVEGAPCPVCGTPLTRIRTGSTLGYVCPGCQAIGTDDV